MIIVDTDVVIWYLRGNEKAAQTLERLDNFCISIVTYMELVQGMRNKEEFRVLRETIRDWSIGVIPVNEQISTRAAFYVEEHFHARSLRLADALIAATAVLNVATLVTGNVKHYKIIKDLTLKQFKP